MFTFFFFLLQTQGATIQLDCCASGLPSQWVAWYLLGSFFWNYLKIYCPSMGCQVWKKSINFVILPPGPEVVLHGFGDLREHVQCHCGSLSFQFEWGKLSQILHLCKLLWGTAPTDINLLIKMMMMMMMMMMIVGESCWRKVHRCQVIDFLNTFHVLKTFIWAIYRLVSCVWYITRCLWQIFNMALKRFMIERFRINYMQNLSVYIAML